jgi:hypothetical protein
LAEGFQRRRLKCEKLTDDKSWQKLTLPFNIYTCPVGSIYGMSSIENAHFVPIGYQTWPPQAILVSDWLISKKSSPLLKRKITLAILLKER